MPIIEYIIKFSLWITATWIFYRAFLAQLTFYRWNRLYLLCYSALGFFVPFFDLAAVIQSAELHDSDLVASVPAVNEYLSVNEGISFTPFTSVVVVLIIGMLVAILRVLVQVLSFRKVSAKAVLLHEEGEVRIYGSEHFQGAFSFGNAIYLNHTAHSHDELKRILLHEIVHVKQKHSVDLILCELVCIVNWFNPFAWMLRKAVKQNLEFIADEKVVASGADPKEYQYLLLKITASPAFHIVSHLNTSNLKKRIAMMNKIKSAKLNLSRFVFIIPLLAVTLLAFRSQQAPVVQATPADGIVIVDTVPAGEDGQVAETQVTAEQSHDKYNSKGYALSVITTNGEAVVLIREKNSRKVQAMTMDEWKRNRAVNERKYGKLPPPPPAPPAPPAVPAPPAPDAKESRRAPEPPVAPDAPPAPPAPARDNSEDLQARVAELQKEQAELIAVQAVKQTEQVNLQQEQQVLTNAQVELQVKQKSLQELRQNIQNQINQNTDVREVRPSSSGPRNRR